jgi:hypothetical protein
LESQHTRQLVLRSRISRKKVGLRTPTHILGYLERS